MFFISSKGNIIIKEGKYNWSKYIWCTGSMGRRYFLKIIKMERIKNRNKEKGIPDYEKSKSLSE